MLLVCIYAYWGCVKRIYYILSTLFPGNVLSYWRRHTLNSSTYRAFLGPQTLTSKGGSLRFLYAVKRTNCLKRLIGFLGLNLLSIMAIIQCPSCGNGVSDQAEFCPKCGAKISQGTSAPINQTNNQGSIPPANTVGKSKTAAGILALFLGGLGVHRFYLRQPLIGLIFLLACWTYIPAIIGFIEGIMLLTQSEEGFRVKPKLLF